MGQEQKVIDTEKKYEGYLEKKNGDKRYLADKTANAGSNNYTIFWDILKPEWQGQPWCSAFQSACFLETYGEEKAQALYKESHAHVKVAIVMALCHVNLETANKLLEENEKISDILNK